MSGVLFETCEICRYTNTDYTPMATHHKLYQKQVIGKFNDPARGKEEKPNVLITGVQEMTDC